MILVSFSSAEDIWFNDVNRYNTFSSQGTENPPFRFFWDTRYLWLKLLKYKEDYKKNCDTFDRNYINIPLYIMS